ncbi:MAG: phosphoglycolate phosphatase [Rhodospirillales bacterium]|nr:phosphoglycolate phosphatase [Rhodospirillales bacterium]
MNDLRANPFEALIFDLDGTLIDSAPDVCASVNRVLEADGRRALSPEETKEMIGWGGRVLLEKALALTGDAGTPEDIDRALEAFLVTYAEHPADHTTVFPGVIEALQHFKDAGFKMAICTNKPTATTPPVLTAMGLDGFFDVVTCGDAVPFSKPDGRHVLACAEQLGVAPDTVVMVGDSENDIHAAVDAGVRSICVTFGYAHVPLDEIGADALIDHFDDLAQALDDISKVTA